MMRMRSTFDVGQRKFLEERNRVQDAEDEEILRPLGRTAHLRTTLYYRVGTIKIPTRKKGARNRFKYENLMMQEIPLPHFLTHDPAIDNCPFCRDAKAQRQPALPSTEDEKKQIADLEPLDRVSADLMEIQQEDIHENTWFLGTQDKKSHYARGLLQYTKSAEDTWDSFKHVAVGFFKHMNTS